MGEQKNNKFLVFFLDFAASMKEPKWFLCKKKSFLRIYQNSQNIISSLKLFSKS
jgi:hypothetical protein